MIGSLPILKKRYTELRLTLLRKPTKRNKPASVTVYDTRFATSRRGN